MRKDKKMSDMNFNAVVKDIIEGKILLPDFQRGFVWKEPDIQIGLAASVLTKLPIGTILLLQSSDPEEYKCRVVGTKKSVSYDKIAAHQQVQFLLDGQQRITVLMNIFSNKVFELAGDPKQIIDSSLKKRFFLSLPSFKYETEENEMQDLFGASILLFPFSVDVDNPNFSTEQIKAMLSVEAITTGKDKKSYDYYADKDTKKKLRDYCVGKMLIPLFLILEDDSKNQWEQIITAIAQKNADEIVNTFSSYYNQSIDPDMENICELMRKLKFSDDDQAEIMEVIQTNNSDQFIESINNKMNDRVQKWAGDMRDYLKSCLSKLMLEKICVGESDRARAIDIYENLNLGGVSLSTFDLLIARSAKSNNESLVSRIEKIIEEQREYKTAYFSDDNIEAQFEKQFSSSSNATQLYSAAESMGCSADNKVYRDTFMNLLALISKSNNKMTCQFNIEWIKRNVILCLSAEQIDGNCDKVCYAIDKALFFLQARCGLRKISEINYSLMLTVISYVMLFDSDYSEKEFKRILSLLEAWYWASIFSGKYNTDQNANTIRDLEHIMENVVSIKQGVSVSVNWLEERISQILDFKGFSDLDFIVNGNKDTEERPKAFLGNAVCQYYLSQGYYDLIFKAEQPSFLTVFHKQADQFEIHHVIPLGSSNTVSESTKKLRKDKGNILNYPMNLLYITPDANKEISARSLTDYNAQLKGYQSLINVGFTEIDSDPQKVLKARHHNMKVKLQSEVKSLLEIFSK